ncbi:hypothetical protein IF2G_09026 [Cordyceps javanica]|nr:hypothetical protein IF2G_09026 [Cordyceps javanica]
MSKYTHQPACIEKIVTRRTTSNTDCTGHCSYFIMFPCLKMQEADHFVTCSSPRILGTVRVSHFARLLYLHAYYWYYWDQHLHDLPHVARPSSANMPAPGTLARILIH